MATRYQASRIIHRQKIILQRLAPTWDLKVETVTKDVNGSFDAFCSVEYSGSKREENGREVSDFRFSISISVFGFWGRDAHA